MEKVKGFITRKYGPLPAWAWVLVVIGLYLAYQWWQGRNASSATTGAGTAAPVGGASGDSGTPTTTPTGTPPPTGGPPSKKKKVWCLVKSPVPHYKKCSELAARKSKGSGGGKESPNLGPHGIRTFPGAGGRNGTVYAPTPSVHGRKPSTGKKAKPPTPHFHPVGQYSVPGISGPGLGPRGPIGGQQ